LVEETKAGILSSMFDEPLSPGTINKEVRLVQSSSSTGLGKLCTIEVQSKVIPSNINNNTTTTTTAATALSQNRGKSRCVESSLVMFIFTCMFIN
jgi:hypothetical protein